MSLNGKDQLLRQARMPTHSMVLISMGALSWVTELENISATGLLTARPAEWGGAVGERCMLDLLAGDDLHIHLEATITRLTESQLAFTYASIPEEKEQALWELLGEYADDLDRPITQAPK